MSGFKIDFDTSDVDRLHKAWAKAPEMVTEELSAAIWKAEMLLQREIQERTPKAVGAGGGLAGSILAAQPYVSSTGVLGVVGTAMNYATAVELGTKPHMPPIKPIMDWAVAVLGVDRKAAKGVAWAVAMKIKKSGTKGAFMFKHGLEENKHQIEAILSQANIRIAQRLANIPDA